MDEWSKRGLQYYICEINKDFSEYERKCALKLRKWERYVESSNITYGGCTRRFAKNRRIHWANRFGPLLLGASFAKRIDIAQAVLKCMRYVCPSVTTLRVIDQGRWQCEIENSSNVNQRQETLAPHSPQSGSKKRPLIMTSSFGHITWRTADRRAN